MSESEAGAYLRSTPTSFWSWGDDGRVLLWADGRTIAFVPEVHAAATRVASAGLPVFGALVLALAAMRDPWRADESQRSSFAGYVRTALSPGAELPGILHDLYRDAMSRLDALAQLPEDLRTGQEARALLVEMFFEGTTPQLKKGATGEVLNILAQRVPDFAEGDSAAVPHAGEALAILKTLAACRVLGDAEAIRIRQRTGLEQSPKAPELPISEVVRGLLNELRGDPELGSVAKLARAVLAVIATPRRLTPESDLPLGGLSDISNRGSLDKLLLTELAHDDLTLAVRVALNEALYYRRESPRSPQAFTRAMLIDSGIRLWGVPRVFATAVALAFAATTPGEATLTVWSARGEELVPVDLTTRKGVLAHLERLESHPHPAAALPALVRRLKEMPELKSETIVVTHPDTRLDLEFQKGLRAAGVHPLMMATVAESGRFELAACSKVGDKPLAEATLKLDDIMPAAAGQAPIFDPREDLPAMLKLLSSPFRLSVTPDLNRAAASKKHGLIAVNHRMLLHWPKPGRPIQLSAALPMGNFLGMGIFEEEAMAVVAHWDPNDKVLHVQTFDLKTREVVNRKITDLARPPISIAGHHGAILIIHRGRVEAYNLRRDAPVASKDFLESCRHLGTRFLERPNGLIWAISYDGSDVRLVDVPLMRSALAVFDRVGVDGPLALYAGGMIHSSVGQVIVKRGPQVLHHTQGHHVSNDGSRLVLGAGGPHPQAIDLSMPEPAWRALDKTTPERFLLGPQAGYPIHVRMQLRRRMQAICVNMNGDLALFSRRSKMVAIAARPMELISCGRYTGGSILRPFKKLPTAFIPIPGLAMATWADGSRAWMDPRGILHLRSSDPVIPECSLLLNQSHEGFSAWASNGETYGAAQFLEETPTGKPEELAELVRAFVGRLE